MRVRIFVRGPWSVPDFEEVINTWLEDPANRIISRHVDASGAHHIYYESPADRDHKKNWQTIQETEDLNRLKEVAAQVRADPGYAETANQRQREIYLMEFYNVNSREADTVREILRMTSVDRIIGTKEDNSHEPTRGNTES